MNKVIITEPEQPTKWHAKTQISLDICPVLSESLSKISDLIRLGGCMEGA